MIENISLYTHKLDIGLGFKHAWTESSCPNNNEYYDFSMFCKCRHVGQNYSWTWGQCPRPLPNFFKYIHICINFSNFFQ